MSKPRVIKNDAALKLLEACEQAESALADALHAGEAGGCDPHLSVPYATNTIRVIQTALAKAKGGEA